MMSDITGDGININLRTRYKRNQIYTFAGSILTAVNPYKQLDIYNAKWINKYRAQKLDNTDPHIFAMAEAMYMNLIMQLDQKLSSNQACVISGESGAGKTETTKFILSYLCSVTPNKSSWMEHQILEANTILEAFGNAKTIRNDNSSRFGKFIQVCFDGHSHIKGCIIQDYLLEQSRITCQCKGERNYHVFYQLIAAGQTNEDLAKRFHLRQCQFYNYLNKSNCYTIDGVDDCSMYDSLRLAMSVLGVPQDNCDGIFSVLSAILWLGNLEFDDTETDGENCKLTAKDNDIIDIVAQLLSVERERLEKLTLSREINVRGTVTAIPFKVSEARDNRNGMAKALYSKTFAWIVNFINASTNPGNDRDRFLGVLDIFGFENFETNSFEQLCINYANEKLHRFFNHHMFALEQELYKQEGVEFCDINYTDNTRCLELLEKPPKCILRLLSEECRMPKGSDQSFVSKLHQEFGGNQESPAHPYYIRGDDRRNWSKEFSVNHFAGPVTYNVEGFLQKNKDVHQSQLFEVIENSSNHHLRDLAKCQWYWSDSITLVSYNNHNNTISSSDSLSSGLSQYSNSLSRKNTRTDSLDEDKNPTAIREKPKLRTQLSLNSNQQISSNGSGGISMIQQRRESLTTSSVYSSTCSTSQPHNQSNKSKPMVADAFRYQLSALVELLNSANPWYVRCIKPNLDKSAEDYDDKQVLLQLKYLGMTDLIKIRREGFPVHFTKHQFVCRYRCLLLKKLRLDRQSSVGSATNIKNISKNDWQLSLDEEQLDETCKRMFDLLELKPNDWKIGKTMVFLRDSIHQPMEEKRKQLFMRQATIIQSKWRSFRVRKNFIQMRRAAIKIQESFLAFRGRLDYLRKKRAAITIQAFVRGMFAREIASALREIKRVEADDIKRAAELERKRLLEREKELEIGSNYKREESTNPETGEKLCNSVSEQELTNDEETEDDDTSLENNQESDDKQGSSERCYDIETDSGDNDSIHRLNSEASSLNPDDSDLRMAVHSSLGSTSTEQTDTPKDVVEDRDLKDKREMDELMQLLEKHGISVNPEGINNDLYSDLKKVYDLLNSKLQAKQDTQSVTSSLNEEDRYSYTTSNIGDGDNISHSDHSQISSTMAESDITQTSTPAEDNNNNSIINSQDGTESDSTKGTDTMNHNYEVLQTNDRCNSIESIPSIASTSSSLFSQQPSNLNGDNTGQRLDSLRQSNQQDNSEQPIINKTYHIPQEQLAYSHNYTMHNQRHEKTAGLLTRIEEEPSSSTTTTPSKTPLKRPVNLSNHILSEINPTIEDQSAQFSQSAEIKRRRFERRTYSQVQRLQQQQIQQQKVSNFDNNNQSVMSQYRTTDQPNDCSDQKIYDHCYGKLNSDAIYETKKCNMIEFAEKVFNDHPKDQSTGGMIRTLTRRRKSNDSATIECLTKREMLMYTSSPSITTSHIKMHDPHNTQLSCSMFKNLRKYMIGEGLKLEMEVRIIQSMIRNGIERVELRDEIYVQIVRQMTNNPSNDQCTRLWILLGLVSAAFSPSKNFSNYLISYLSCKPRKDPSISCHAQFCLDNLQAPRMHPRKLPPSVLEIQACKNITNLICKVHLLDGRCENLAIHPCDTVHDVLANLATKIHLHSIDGWSIYESHTTKTSKSTNSTSSDGDYERALRSHFYIMDVVAMWKMDLVKCLTPTAVQMAQKQLYDGNFKLTLKKRLFRSVKHFSEPFLKNDAVEIGLLYAQALIDVVKKDNFAAEEKLALGLAGIQAQIKHMQCPFDQNEVNGKLKKSSKNNGLKTDLAKLSIKYNPDEYICTRLRKQSNRTKKEWINLIFESHKRCAVLKDTSYDLKKRYLSLIIQHCRLYGTGLYNATYLGYQMIGPQVLLGVNFEGVEILDTEHKNRINFYRYEEIEPKITIYTEENLLQINLLERANTTLRCLTFQTKEKEDIALLITSYSAAHGINWTGYSNASQQSDSDFVIDPCLMGRKRKLKMTLEDRMRLHQDVQVARQDLSKSGMLRSPVADLSNSSMRSTLRKWSSSKSKAERNKAESIYDTGRDKMSELSHTYSDYGIYNEANQNIYETKESMLGGATTARDIDGWTKQYPHSYWAYSKYPLNNSLLIIYDRDLEETALANFNSILTYSGLNILNSDYSTIDSSGGISSVDSGSIDSGIASQQSLSTIVKNGSPSSSSSTEIYDVCPRPINQSEQIKLAQGILDRCLRKDADILRNEFFLQLIKQTTDHPDPNSQINSRHWQLLALACSVTYPSDRKILRYLYSHLRRCSLDQVTDEGQYAKFTLRNLQGTIETKGRKLAPSESEILSTINCRQIYATVYFLDGQCQTVEFGPCVTIGKVVEQIKLKIGLRKNADGYALFQPLDDHSEQVLQPNEKVGDAISYWELWHKEKQEEELQRHLQQMNSNGDTRSNASGSLNAPMTTITRNRVHRFIFKKYLFTSSNVDLDDLVEKQLLYHQIFTNIKQDRFPLDEREGAYLCALKTQIDYGNQISHLQIPSKTADNLYCTVWMKMMPPRTHSMIPLQAIAIHHQAMRDMTKSEAKISFFNLIESFARANYANAFSNGSILLHRASIYEAEQTFASAWPRELWLAIDQSGLHILASKTKVGSMKYLD